MSELQIVINKYKCDLETYESLYENVASITILKPIGYYDRLLIEVTGYCKSTINLEPVYSVFYKQVFKKLERYPHNIVWGLLKKQSYLEFKDSTLESNHKAVKLILECKDKISMKNLKKEVSDSKVINLSITTSGEQKLNNIIAIIENHLELCDVLIKHEINPSITRTLLSNKSYITECPFLIPEIPLNTCVKIYKIFKPDPIDQKLIYIYRIIGVFIRILTTIKKIKEYTKLEKIRELCDDDDLVRIKELKYWASTNDVSFYVRNCSRYRDLENKIKEVTGSYKLDSLELINNPICQHGTGIHIFYDFHDEYMLLKKDYSDRKIIRNKLVELDRFESGEINLKKYIDKIDPKKILDSHQLEALDVCLKNNLAVISGSAGSGKTKVLNSLYKIYRREYGDGKIKILTPTGASALRAGSGSSTLHSYYHKIIYSGIESDIETIIIDEISMVDMAILAKVIECTPNLKRLYLFGDKNQLPPVDNGHFLHQLLLSDFVKDRTVILKGKHRSNHSINEILSSIIEEGEYKINPKIITNDANIPILLEELEETYGQVLESASDWTKIAVVTHTNDNAEELYKKLKPIYRKSKHVNTSEVESIKYVDGTKILETMTLNKIFIDGKRLDLKKGDIIVYKENKYGIECEKQNSLKWEKSKHDIINGQRAKLLDIYFSDNKIMIEIQISSRGVNGNRVSENIRYEHCDDITFTQGLVTTIHKVQGEEYETVFIDFEGRYVNRELIYTAMSRAKNKIYSINIENGNSKICQRAKHPKDIFMLMFEGNHL